VTPRAQHWPDGYERPREARALHPRASRGRPAPCGTYTHLRWPAPRRRFGGFTSFDWQLTPELDTDQGYFWAHQFAFRDSGYPQRGGYVGLQANGTYSPTSIAKVAIFSIWDGLDATGPGAARPFGGEGTGYQTLVLWPWVAGRCYDLSVRSLAGDEQSGTWWVGLVRDTVTGDESEIGRILVPPRWGGLDTWSVVWTEMFAPSIERCDDMECASAVFARFRADNDVEPVRLDPRFGDPATCANSRIALLDGGAVRQQMGLPEPGRAFWLR
jgi:Domain of unknown function (DUF3472)